MFTATRRGINVLEFTRIDIEASSRPELLAGVSAFLHWLDVGGIRLTSWKVSISAPSDTAESSSAPKPSLSSLSATRSHVARLSIGYKALLGAPSFIAGDFVIVNDADRPDDRHIARVASINEDGTVNADYVNIKWDHMQNIRTATLVADFGRNVFNHEFGHFCTAPSSKPSVATYRDGKPRKWQGV